LSEDDRFVLGLVLDEVRALGRIIQGVLDSARIDIGVPGRVSLTGLLERVGQFASGRAAPLGRGIRVDVPRQDVAAIVWERAMERAVTNLLNNAVEASKAGDVIVLGWRELTALETESHFPGFEGRVVGLYVRDLGPGLPEDPSVSAIFRPFVGTKRSHLGLGLAVAREIVERHLGVIDIHTDPGGGTRAEIFLELADPVSCWDDRSLRGCHEQSCSFQCENCEVKSSRTLMSCWGVKGSAHRTATGVWPRECRACEIFGSHDLVRHR